MEQVNSELAALDGDIDDRIKGSRARRAAEHRITAVPGIGPITLPRNDLVVRGPIPAGATVPALWHGQAAGGIIAVGHD